MVKTLTSLKVLDDTELIRLHTKKEPDALNILMKRYLKPVYSYVYHYVQSPELAEDLTQETFLRAYRSLAGFDRRRPFKPWLFAIATNVCKTALRQKRNQAIPFSEDAEGMNILENCIDPGQATDEISDQRVQGLIHQSLAKLSPSVRQALILRHVYDMPYDVVAETMAANLNTVRTWLKRGRESLKTLLEPHGGVS
jgi:RNA polymerase sigma-70 factor, ECF subfamily